MVTRSESDNDEKKEDAAEGVAATRGVGEDGGVEPSLAEEEMAARKSWDMVKDSKKKRISLIQSTVALRSFNKNWALFVGQAILCTKLTLVLKPLSVFRATFLVRHLLLSSRCLKMSKPPTWTKLYKEGIIVGHQNKEVSSE